MYIKYLLLFNLYWVILEKNKVILYRFFKNKIYKCLYKMFYIYKVYVKYIFKFYKFFYING